MSDLRRLLAISLQSSDLSTNANEESAIDRILALATADRLGSLLWRLRLVNDARSFHPAALILAHRVRRSNAKGRPLTHAVEQRLAERVITEWLDDVCRACVGRGHRVAKDSPVALHACTTCNGTGRRRHSDAERAKAMGFTVSSHAWSERFAWAHALVAAVDRQTWVSVAVQLERISGRPGLAEKLLHDNNNDVIMRDAVGVSVAVPREIEAEDAGAAAPGIAGRHKRSVVQGDVRAGGFMPRPSRPRHAHTSCQDEAGAAQ